MAMINVSATRVAGMNRLQRRKRRTPPAGATNFILPMFSVTTKHRMQVNRTMTDLVAIPNR
jgi:hypothetical protein